MSRVLNSGVNKVTQSYAQHRGWAKGIDIVKAPYYTSTIVAHSEGVVIKVMTGQKNGSTDREGFGFGNYVMISHGNNYVTTYAHLAKVNVVRNQVVKQGQKVGFMGNTGNSFGAHLHFEVRKYKVDPTTLSPSCLHDTSMFEWVDPTPFINADLPIVKVNTDVPTNTDYSNNTIDGRFKVKLRGVQKNAYTNFSYACKYADSIGGVVIDSTTGKQIYPTSEDYTKSTAPNRFKVWVGGKQISAFTSYTNAVKAANANNGVVLDGNNGNTQIYPV